MKPLPEVEAAKSLMTEAMDWSVMKWLSEKKRVRKAADLANDTLDRRSKEIKATWPEPLKAAYQELKDKTEHKTNGSGDNENMLLAKRVREADAEAYRIRMDAEDIFDRAERRLSTSMARDGARRAIEGWLVHEKALRLAESGTTMKKSVA